MKVFIICKEPFPYGLAATQRILCYAKAIIKQSVECTVVIYHRTEKGRFRRNTRAKGIFEGVPFVYPGGSTRKPGHKILRLPAETFDKLCLKFYLRKNLSKDDVVIGYVNADTDFLCGIIDLIHKKKAKYVRELCEIPFYGSADHKAELERILSSLFPKCDGFIAISDTLFDLAEKNSRSGARIIKIPILVDSDKLRNSEGIKQKTDVPYIFHSGTLYEQKDGITSMLAAFGKAKAKLGKPVKIILTGPLSDSPDSAAIEKTIQEYKLTDSVEFTGYLKTEEVDRYLAGSAFAVINKPDSIQNNYGFPTKLASYMAAGKAVIITDAGEAMNWLNDGVTAWIVKRGDTAALAEAIEFAFRNPDECRRIGENGRKLCDKCFDWRSNSEKMVDFLGKI